MRNLRRVADEPIIQSLLDIDFYKFTMGQLIFMKHPDVPVLFSSKNRTKGVNLREHIDMGELREQLEHVRSLSFSNSDLHYLRGTNEYGERMFKEPYLDFLRKLRMPSFDLRINNTDFRVDFPGPWSEATYWETIALSIMNELYYRSIENGLTTFERETHYAQGITRLAEKVRKVKAHGRILFSEFGTRRRYSRKWQEHVVEILRDEIPAHLFRGTSNTYLANKLGILPMGSNAHELPMAYSGIYHLLDEGPRLLISQGIVLKDWEELYGLGLSIALSDTFGSDYFCEKIFTQKQYENWKGFRQDSGDPIEYGEKRIADYHDNDVDPSKKMILFSDGLDVDRIIEIHDHFEGRIISTFGWGTDLTNDLGFKPLSLVVKVTEAAGQKVVKLSDNIEKATGDPESIERMKQMVGYQVDYAQACKY